MIDPSVPANQMANAEYPGAWGSGPVPKLLYTYKKWPGTVDDMQCNDHLQEKWQQKSGNAE